MTTTYARANLYRLIDEVAEAHQPVCSGSLYHPYSE